MGVLCAKSRFIHTSVKGPFGSPLNDLPVRRDYSQWQREWLEPRRVSVASWSDWKGQLAECPVLEMTTIIGARFPTGFGGAPGRLSQYRRYVGAG